MDEEIKRWTARRKTALVPESIQGKTMIAEASRAYDLPPSELESWVEDGENSMENALRANPQDVREQYERQLKDLQEAYGEAMQELRARKKFQALIARFGTLGHVPQSFLLRSDNGLVFTSRSFTALVKSCGLRQEFITPHSPEQNGKGERMIRTLKEQCVHRHRFESLQHASRVIGD